VRRRNFKIALHIALSLCFFFPGFSSAQEPVFSAVVSSTQVTQNMVFEIRFELENANGSNFIPPDFGEFRVVGGPAQGSSTVIINGKVSRSQSWTYSLLAPSHGTFTIGAASVVAGRRKLTTRPVIMQVRKAADLAAPGSADPGGKAIRLVAVAGPGNYYPGQQITLEYKLIFSENVQTANTLSEDDYSGFFVQTINTFNREPSYQNIRGTTFATRALRSVALFAHQSGTYTIDPLIMDIGINAPYPVNEGFFTMRRLHNVQVASEPLTIQVLPLPEDIPGQNFSGAVGHYDMKVISSNSSDLSTDDDFKLTIELTGDGDPRRWDPPAVASDGKFELYDPKILEDDVIDSEGKAIHRRIIEYVMIPASAGEYQVYVPFRYFDPTTESYRTISSDTFSLQISQGHLQQRRAIMKDDSTAVNLPIHEVRLTKTEDRFWRAPLHISLFGLLLLGTFFGIWKNRQLKKEATVSPDERLRSAASKHARSQLDHLQHHSQQITNSEFYEKATAAYYKYLLDKFNIPASSLDSGTLDAYFKKNQVPSIVAEKALAFFEECLTVRYGGIPGGHTREEMILRCKSTIDELDRSVRHHI
jgi:hypothetical protein